MNLIKQIYKNFMTHLGISIFSKDKQTVRARVHLILSRCTAEATKASIYVK